MNLRVLIADDERPARFGMSKALARQGVVITEAADGEEALIAIRSGAADLVFLDLNMPGLDGVGVLRESEGSSRPEIIVVTASDSIQKAVECIRLGAADYITKPFEIERLRAIVRRAMHRLELESRVVSLQERLDEKGALGALVGGGTAMRELYRRIERAATAPVDVLIRGETGTGKELIARELHRLSGRKGAFISVNTAAVAESLAESELFGHVRGAFTGAESDRKGVFEQAHGGTVFLDEIGDMPMGAQAKILRVLQERVVQPVGGARTIPVDVRVISATHQDLEAAANEGHFRKDLYYRIRGIELTAPPLRNRREDIIPLAVYFLSSLAGAQSSPTPTLSPSAVEKLLLWTWPGNVRELKQAVQSAAAMANGPELSAADFSMIGSAPAGDAGAFDRWLDLPLSEAKGMLLEEFERTAIERALDNNAGNVSAAARALGLHRQSLQQKMTQLDIRRWKS